MFKKQKDYPLSEMEKRILEEWETAWKGAQGEDDDENTQTDANKMLYDLVRENYNIFARKAALNRDDNYAQKNWLLYGIGIAVFVESILLLLLTIYWEKMEWSSSGLIMYVVYFSAFQAILFCAAGKKIAVDKKQETWARHTDALGRLQDAMVRYTQGLSPYEGLNDEEKRKMFARRFLRIVNLNRKKFVKNMESKEADLTDLLEKLKLTKL